MQNTKLEAAKKYLAHNWNVIPLGVKEKKPNFSALKSTGHGKTDANGILVGGWESFQTERATNELLEAWWQHSPESNVGIVTGKISNLIVVDIDPRHGGNESFEKMRSLLPKTYIVKTGGGGAHYYYEWPFQIPPPNKINYRPGIDIKGEGGYVVAPPSIHPDGGIYESVDGFDGIDDISQAPEWLSTLEEDSSASSWEKYMSGVSEGSRNEAAASVCGRFFFELNQEDWETKGWRQLVEWNKRNSPPLLENELRAVFESILKKAQVNPPSNNSKSKGIQADAIVHLILRDDPILFHDEQREGYIRIQVVNHQEVLKIDSQTFEYIVDKKIWDEWRKIPSAETIKQALAVLKAKAIHEGDMNQLSLRVTEKDKSFWYDMGDKEWRAVKIDQEGWSTVSRTPILFKRQSHQLSQVEADKSGDVLKFLKYLNIPDSNQQTLALIYLIASFIPGISHPILILHGEQGSAKSTMLRFMRKLVDPSATELLSFSKNQSELIQQLAHHYAAYYDNLSGISNAISDLLCKAVTGDAHSKRALYTNDDDIIFILKNCLALNGINVVAFRSDLLDRSILIHLERIDPLKRKSEKELMSNFEADRPIILGGIFDTISRAMKLKDGIKSTSIPRMADFFLWGCAIAEALGIGQGEFTEAYNANEMTKHEQVANENPVAMQLLQHMKQNYFFEGTAQKLFNTLNKEMDNGMPKNPYWPKAPNTLMREINKIKPDLKALGVEIQQSRSIERSLVITYQASSEPSYRQNDELEEPKS